MRRVPLLRHCWQTVRDDVISCYFQSAFFSYRLTLLSLALTFLQQKFYKMTGPFSVHVALYMSLVGGLLVMLAFSVMYWQIRLQ